MAFQHQKSRESRSLEVASASATARQQLLVFLHFHGINSFYNLMHSCHGVSSSTVWHIIHHFVPAIISFWWVLIWWPGWPLSIASEFRDIAGFLCVAGCFDETRIPVNPPCNDEDTYINLHHSKSQCCHGSRPRLHHHLLDH